jgi:hypothetical protein
VTDLAPIDFTPYGLSGDWRSWRLSMVEGQRWDRPGWAFGFDTGHLELVPVSDTGAYGFDPAAPWLARYVPEGASPRPADQLHRDHLPIFRRPHTGPADS